jgi:hypothetical protein
MPPSRACGGELVGEVENYKDIYRLCYVRGPERISRRAGGEDRLSASADELAREPSGRERTVSAFCGLAIWMQSEEPNPARVVMDLAKRGLDSRGLNGSDGTRTRDLRRDRPAF